MAGFVQIIEFTTSRFEEIERLSNDYDLEAGGNTARRVTIAEDRDNPGTYFNIVEFDSYESAMQNSSRPEVAEFADQLSKICEGPPKFHNLDIRLTP
jgi:quinol monooxygenase YgiN